jgi:hypothetical protein
VVWLNPRSNFHRIRCSSLQKLSSKHWFHKIQLSDSHTSAKGINEILPVSCTYIIRFGQRLVPEIPTTIWFWVLWKSVQWTPYVSQGSEWLPICSVHVYDPVWVKYDARDLHIMWSRIHEFYGNWHSEGCSFLMGINVITFVCVL